MVDIIDSSIMYHYNIDPNTLDEDSWGKAYIALKEILKKKQ